uniref:NS1 n=1 Tax=uncultured densovirus TaxID=748192 RepID=A0A7M4CBH8_9VIRU|nr:NS1 [uncultured densovirus]
MKDVEEKGDCRAVGVGGGGGEEPAGEVGEEGHLVCSGSTHDPAESTTTEPGTSGVSAGAGVHVGGGIGAAGRDRELPTWLSKSSADLEQQYWKGFEERADRIFGELQRSDGELVRDVFRFENTRELEDFLRCIQTDANYRRGLLQVCGEATHVHVVHDCAYGNGTCRCNWYKKAKTYGAHDRRDRRANRRNSCRSRTRADVQSLLFYYCSKGRSILYQKIGGTVVRIPSEGYNLSTSRLTSVLETIGEMAKQIPRARDKLQSWGPDLDDDEPVERDTVELPRRKRRKVGAQERIQIMTVELLESNPIVPPEAIVKTKAWRDTPELKFKNMSDKEIKAAVSMFKDQLTTYSMADYQEMYNKENCMPRFSCGAVPFDTYYYNVANSLEMMDKLVEFQCGEDDDAKLEFIMTLYDVLERRVPKLNCIVIHSPPSAGKNFFFDAVRDYYINCGHLNNANRYNNFPFQDAEGRRIVMWNEPNYSPDFLEPIKEILGGDSTSVNVKYQHDTPVYRTPVIVLTNNVVSFMTHHAFVDRVRVFRWRAAPWLKDYDKKPNPLAVPLFFAKYGLGK